MAAALGNKYAIGNNGGCPPIFDTPEELTQKSEEYFEYIKGEFHIEQKLIPKEDGEGKELADVKVWDRYPEPASITGLVLFLGFSSRSSLVDYQKRGDEFSHIIKRAKLRVEHEYEKQLDRDKPTGAIFALKNMGWTDRMDLDHTSKGNELKQITGMVIK